MSQSDRGMSVRGTDVGAILLLWHVRLQGGGVARQYETYREHRALWQVGNGADLVTASAQVRPRMPHISLP
jgi:hypothetical protein